MSIRSRWARGVSRDVGDADSAGLQKPAGSRGEILIFRKSHAPEAVELALQKEKTIEDLEISSSEGPAEYHQELERLRETSTRRGLAGLVKSKDVFTLQNVSYDLVVNGVVQRRLLDNVHGYVKPGTLTALTRESSAGKTTLLRVLAPRLHTRIVSGDMLVNGSALDVSFQRRSGYVQQQLYNRQQVCIQANPQNRD